MMTDVTRCDETKRTEAATNAVQCRGSFPLKHKPTLMIFGPLWLTERHVRMEKEGERDRGRARVIQRDRERQRATEIHVRMLRETHRGRARVIQRDRERQREGHTHKDGESEREGRESEREVER